MNERKLPPHSDMWSHGLDLYAAGRHWEAHEAWEQIWLGEQDAAKKTFLRAVIQMAAAMVKAEQENMAGVVKNLGKAVENLASRPLRCRGIDTGALAAACERCARHAQEVQAAGRSFDWILKPALSASASADG